MLSGLVSGNRASAATRASAVIARQHAWNQTRSITHAFVRPPGYHCVPVQSPTGQNINRDMLLHQFRDFFKTLQQSALIDKLHVLTELQSFEAVRTSDQMLSVGATTIAMPLHGTEQRYGEYQETMRFIRSSGGPKQCAAYLQDVENCRCHSGDVVMLPTGMAVANGPRTNLTAHEALRSLYVLQDQFTDFDVFTVEQESDAPPLKDYFGFAGRNVLVVWKDEHGMLAVDQYQKYRPDDDVQVVYVEPGCNFLSFFGVDFTNDILVQQGYQRSMESLAHAGLNPIPVQWSEMDKLGVSMNSAVLILNFLSNQNNFSMSTDGTGHGSLDNARMPARNKNRAGRWAAHKNKQVS